MDELEKLGEVRLWTLVAVVLILICQSTWLFIDARKHSRYPWFWGLWGLIQAPMPLLFYWLIVRSGFRFGRRKR